MVQGSFRVNWYFTSNKSVFDAHVYLRSSHKVFGCHLQIQPENFHYSYSDFYICHLSIWTFVFRFFHHLRQFWALQYVKNLCRIILPFLQFYVAPLVPLITSLFCFSCWVMMSVLGTRSYHSKIHCKHQGSIYLTKQYQTNRS